MKLDERVRPILEEINFIGRYKKLSDENHDLDNRMDDYSNAEVINIAKRHGFDLSFSKKENFFKYIESNGGLETQLNISLKYGSVELILGIENGGERYTVGGPFGMIARLMGEQERIKKPTFSTFEQLDHILEVSFSIYTDIKNRLLTNLSE